MKVFSEKIANKTKLLANKDKIRNDIKKFYQDNYEKFSGRDSNLSYINQRTKLIEDFINNYI